MRIALITDGIYPYVLGGMQKHSYYLAKYLARNGVYVDLYHTGGKDADTPRLLDFTEEELSYITPYYVLFPSTRKLPGHYVVESYLYSAKVYQLFRENEPVDFVYAQGFTGWKTIIEKKKGKALPPIGVNFHGVEMFQQAPNFNVKLQHLLLGPPVKYILRNTDYVFSLGGKLTPIQRRITTKQILEIPIGIEPHWLERSQLVKANKIRKFVFIGRYERRKGIEELQEVIKHLSGKYNFKVSFIGPIPAEKQLKYDEIDYHGLIRDEQEIKAILQTSDVLVCPSYSEGMPTVILEAMASGLAVIATDVGAVSALVSTETGWLIPAADNAVLFQAMKKAITFDEAELQAKKINAVNLIAESYTWDKVIASTLNQISALIK